MYIFKVFLSSIAIFLMVASATQAQGFDPERPCGASLRQASDQEKLLIAAWVFGYRAGTENDTRVVNRHGMVTVLNNVFTACGKDDTRSLLALMQQPQQDDGATTGVSGETGAGTKASAERLLTRFVEPGADHAALTFALKPTEADIAAVYGEPLATKLIEMYGEIFVAGNALGPKPEHDAVLVVYTTTAQLKQGAAVIDEFPGGYKEINQFYIGNHPIVRFKFVINGQTSGLAADGLIHVNGRWVLMPKPWRANK